MVIYGDRKLFLGAVLADYVLIEEFLYFEGFRELIGSRRRLVRFVIFQDRVANGNALIANIGSGVVAWRRDQFPDNILTFMAERAAQGLIGSGSLHTLPPASEMSCPRVNRNPSQRPQIHYHPSGNRNQ